jgi:hypothetical protein
VKARWAAEEIWEVDMLEILQKFLFVGIAFLFFEAGGWD